MIHLKKKKPKKLQINRFVFSFKSQIIFSKDFTFIDKIKSNTCI